MAGRPRRTFSEEQVQEIERLALMNCQNNTIAVAMQIPLMTLKRSFGKKIIHWRAKYKTKLRENQANLSKTSADMCKFLGQNVLGQTNKQVLETKQTAPEITEAQRKATEAAAHEYKLRLVRPSA